MHLARVARARSGRARSRSACAPAARCARPRRRRAPCAAELREQHVEQRAAAHAAQRVVVADERLVAQLGLARGRRSRPPRRAGGSARRPASARSSGRESFWSSVRSRKLPAENRSRDLAQRAGRRAVDQRHAEVHAPLAARAPGWRRRARSRSRAGSRAGARRTGPSGAPSPRCRSAARGRSRTTRSASGGIERLPGAGVAVQRVAWTSWRGSAGAGGGLSSSPQVNGPTSIGDRPPQDLDLGVPLGAPRRRALEVQLDADAAQRHAEHAHGEPDAEVDHEHEVRREDDQRVEREVPADARRRRGRRPSRRASRAARCWT